MREVIFFSNIADRLKNKNINPIFITFFEPGDKYLLNKGYRVISLHKYAKNYPSSSLIEKYEIEYGIKNIRELLLHEKLTFNRFNEKALIKKSLLYFDIFRDVLNTIDAKCVIQELGGFIAPLSLFHSCKKFNINHIFIEPAMFSGRIFFTLNQINCIIKEQNTDSPEITEAINQHIAFYNSHKAVVAPEKDKHHFMDASLRKLLNTQNFKKLKTKLVNKYIRSFSEEYDAIGNHVANAVRMYINRKRNAGLYSTINNTDKFVYYPFHVPLDFQLTVRSNEYLDQISLLKYIANVLPYGYKLYVKEHPAAVGAYSHKELSALIHEGNVKIIHPSVNSYDLIANSKCVLTINSKVGAEALLQKKKVVVLGDAFYKSQGLTIDVENLKELKTILNDINDKYDNGKVDNAKLMHFLKKVYAASYPAELYVNTESNLSDFSAALYDFMLKEKII